MKEKHDVLKELSEIDSLETLVNQRRLRGDEEQSWSSRVRCSGLQLTLSTRLLSVLLASGIPIGDSLKIVAEQCADPNLVEVWWSVRESVIEGSQLSEALERFPLVFGLTYLTVVRTGEASGSLGGCLARLEQLLERRRSLGSQLKAALCYPIFVLVFSGLLSWWLFAQVLPPFLHALSGLEVALPISTRLLVWVAEFLASAQGWTTLLGLVLLGLQALRYTRQRPFLGKLYRFSRRLPGLGPLIRFSGNAQVATSGAVLLRSGSDAVTAWRSSLAVAGDPSLEHHSIPLVKAIETGQQASDYFRSHPHFFPRVFTQMVKAGEETGRLPEFLERVSLILEQELEYRLSVALAALEPVLMATVSLVMLAILLSVALPLYAHLSPL